MDFGLSPGSTLHRNPQTQPVEQLCILAALVHHLTLPRLSIPAKCRILSIELVNYTQQKNYTVASR